MLRSEIITEFLQLFHVLLDPFALLVASKLDLIDSLKHVGFPLLSRLELADEKRTATEGSLRCLNPRPLSILDTLVAHKAEAKHTFIRVLANF